MYEKYKSTINQFLKFVVVGVINTAINFIILNILSAITGITSGGKIIPLAVVAFAVATTNSYIWNKRWSFKDQTHTDTGRKFSLFLIVSIIGAGINSGTVYLITTHISPMFGLSQHLWLNVAALAATGISLIWNFIGYKLFVFKK
ncbi:MAG: GtrA family protein [Candidatus Doudnabacteria bacterium]